MPSSIASLESLSSPSPSPPPPETHTVSSSSNRSAAGAGLDSGSELSELTEDEQEIDNDNNDNEDRTRPTRRGGRRKRGGIVPAPMWDWAYKTKKGDWRTKLIEEEEEEEQAGPAKAMEEEEDEDREHDSRVSGRVAARHVRGNGVDPALDDCEDIPEDEDDVSVSHVADPINDDPDYALDEEDGDPDPDADLDNAPPSRRVTAEMSPVPTDDENAEDDDGDPTITRNGNTAQALEAPADSDDEGNNPQLAQIAPAKTQLSVSAATIPASAAVNADDILDAVDADAAYSMDVDETAPPPAMVSPIIAAAAASSIMAGSTVVKAPSPSPSSSSVASGSARGSPSSSRSPSPEPVSDREPEPKASTSRVSGKSRTGARARTSRAARTKARRRAKPDATVEQDADVDQAAAEADERDLAEGEEIDAESPEMDHETDLQPAHRAEALDVLATIELRFALLRERLYVEKMEGLAWEEALVAEGTHPEMLHLHAELSKRRDKRLELASRRREFEVANVTKRRKLDEEGVWSWWKLARDELQTEMISETNRKRRRLDRERRALDRPQPVRRFPNPPLDVPVPRTLREIAKAYPFGSSNSKKPQNPVNSLAYPQLSTLSPNDVAGDLQFLFEHRRAAGGYEPPRPGLMGMNPLIGHGPGMAHGFEQYHLGMGMLDGPVMGRFGPPHQLPHQHIVQHSQVPGQMLGYSGPVPRMQHHSAPPTGSIPHAGLMMDHDIAAIHRPVSEAASNSHAQQYAVHGPGPVQVNLMRRSISPVPVPVQPYVNGPGGSSGPGPSSLGGLKSSNWSAIGGPDSAVHPTGVKELKRLNGGSREFESQGQERDRERERDRDRFPDSMQNGERNEREMEKAHHMSQISQRQHQHPHPHVHVPGQPPHLHSGSHHHHHHHHHVRHHHHPNASNGINIGGQPSNNLPILNGVSPAPGVNPSHHGPRDVDLRRPHSGAPTEVIDLSSVPKLAPSSASSLWRGNEEASSAPAPSEFSRDRARLPLGPPPVGPHERLMTPFVMTPSQAVQAGFPPSPRSAPGPSTAPASMAPSRRGSLSGLEENSVPRPSSSASLRHPSNHAPANSAHPGSHRHTSSGHQLSHGSPLLQSQRASAAVSPQRTNGVSLPPLSPTNAPAMRSPLRMGQPLPPPIPATHSQAQHGGNSTPKLRSPILHASRHSSPPPPRTKSPGLRGHHNHNNSAASISPAGNVVQRMSSPISLFPPPSSHPPPRLPGVAVVPEKHSPSLASAPKMNAVPVDGP